MAADHSANTLLTEDLGLNGLSVSNAQPLFDDEDEWFNINHEDSGFLSYISTIQSISESQIAPPSPLTDYISSPINNNESSSIIQENDSTHAFSLYSSRHSKVDPKSNLKNDLGNITKNKEKGILKNDSILPPSFLSHHGTMHDSNISKTKDLNPTLGLRSYSANNDLSQRNSIQNINKEATSSGKVSQARSNFRKHISPIFSRAPISNPTSIFKDEDKVANAHDLERPMNEMNEDHLSNSINAIRDVTKRELTEPTDINIGSLSAYNKHNSKSTVEEYTDSYAENPLIHSDVKVSGYSNEKIATDAFLVNDSENEFTSNGINCHTSQLRDNNTETENLLMVENDENNEAITEFNEDFNVPVEQNILQNNSSQITSVQSNLLVNSNAEIVNDWSIFCPNSKNENSNDSELVKSNTINQTEFNNMQITDEACVINSRDQGEIIEYANRDITEIHAVYGVNVNSHNEPLVNSVTVLHDNTSDAINVLETKKSNYFEKPEAVFDDRCNAEVNDILSVMPTNDLVSNRHQAAPTTSSQSGVELDNSVSDYKKMYEAVLVKLELSERESAYWKEKATLLEDERNSLQEEAAKQEDLLRDLSNQILESNGECSVLHGDRIGLSQEVSGLGKIISDFYLSLGGPQEEKIAFRGFKVGSIALFFPTPSGAFLAFHINAPHHFLAEECKAAIGRSTHFKPYYILGKILQIESFIASASDNPYGLLHETIYHVLTVVPITRDSKKSKSEGPEILK